MKQHITLEQLNELSPEAREKLAQYCASKQLSVFVSDGDCRIVEQKATAEHLPLLSIGQMIEFLDDARTVAEIIGAVEKEKYCDALWEAVKEVLK